MTPRGGAISTGKNIGERRGLSCVKFGVQTSGLSCVKFGVQTSKELAKKVKEIIDTKSSFADWLNNQNVRNQLKLEIKICLIKNGYPPQYSPEVFTKVMEQVENFEENS